MQQGQVSAEAAGSTGSRQQGQQGAIVHPRRALQKTASVVGVHARPCAPF